MNLQLQFTIIFTVSLTRSNQHFFKLFVYGHQINTKMFLKVIKIFVRHIFEYIKQKSNIYILEKTK